MSTELSRVAPAKQLTLPTRDIADLVARYLNHVEREDYVRAVITVDIPPKDRTELSSRLCHIDAVCVPKPDDAKFRRARIDKAVSYMISMFTVGRKVSDKEAEATAKGYVMAMEGIPAHFVEQACVDFTKGNVPSHDNAFTPTSAEVRARAEELMVPFREEGAKIRTILGARRQIKPTPEEHQRMLAKTTAIINGTDPDIRAMRDRIEADRQENLDRQMQQIGRTNEIQRRRYCAQFGIDPEGIVSPSLVKKIRGALA